MRAREDHQRLAAGIRGQALPMAVGPRQMTFDDDGFAVLLRQGRHVRRHQSIGISADQGRERIRRHQRQHIGPIGHSICFGNVHDTTGC
jgi:hypothetical protein